MIENYYGYFLTSLLLLSFSTSYGQLKLNLEVGPNHDGVERVEVCFSITNTFLNTFDFNPADDQQIVIQFGHPPFEGDFTQVPDCLDPRNFQFVRGTLSSVVNESTISSADSDDNDYEMAFRFNQRVSIPTGQTLDFGCIQNLNINCFCDSLIAFIDCYGIQHAEFQNGNVIVSGDENCTKIEFPPPILVEENVEIFCEQKDDQKIIVWEPLDGVDQYQIKLNDSEWQTVSGVNAIEIQDSFGVNIVNVTIRALTGCMPEPKSSIVCTFTSQVDKDVAYVPNAFSPNGDGIHDNFRIEPKPTYTLKQYSVYDRYGTLIFKSQMGGQLQVNTWDGTNNGRMLPPQVLTVHAEVEDLSGNTIYVTKDVTIIN